MKAILFNYRCANCNSITKAPGLSDMAYGEFIMFNKSGGSVYLNAITDSVFDQFRALFKDVFKKYYKYNKDISSFLQETFNVTCDLSPDGTRYSINQFPMCKNCGSREMASWGPKNPFEYSDEMQSPTHDEWNKLTDIEKKLLVEEEIKRIIAEKNK